MENGVCAANAPGFADQNRSTWPIMNDPSRLSQPGQSRLCLVLMGVLVLSLSLSGGSIRPVIDDIAHFLRNN